MTFTFIASYFWWRLIGISLCAFMLPAYLLYFRKNEVTNKIATIIFGITIVLVHAFICYYFGFLAFIVGIIVWTILAFLLNKLFANISAEEEEWK